ncbi:MAG: sugar phosphate isomerase/epimerase [Syntrophobacterales bacterium]|nr:sugar phosphate isomerase/epimerase [Syntrophobacterales bacterium]
MTEFSEIEQEILLVVHIGMPWKFILKYIDLLFHEGMAIEIGIGSEELDNASRREFISISEELRSRGVEYSVHGPFWDLCPGSVDPLIRNVSFIRFHQLMDVCELIHPCQVVCHTGFDPRHHREHVEEFIDRSMAFWESIAKRAEHIGTPVAIENVWEETPDIHWKILNRVGSPYLGFCLDVGHRNTFAKAPLEEWIEVLAPYLKEIHLHDNDGSEDTHFPPGTGTVDFSGLFKKLLECRVSPILTIEPHREDHFYESIRNLSKLIPPEFLKPRRKTLAK